MKHLYIFIITILFATNILAQTNSVTDIDGNIYPTIEIGNQVWMAEDLRVTHYPNGDPIPNVTANSSWASLVDNDFTDAYSFYNNNSNTAYGAVYTYAAAIGDNWQRDSVEGQGICPCGWHLPTDTEWTELINHLEGASVAGGKIRESGTTHWSSPNTGATNESGFTALPGGFRDYNCGAHGYLGSYAGWWTANEYTAYPTLAFRYLTNTNSASIDRSFNNKSYGFSVRCVKNEVITHTVIFFDWDGSGIDTVQVENGSNATPPNDPVREGYIFTGWDIEYTNVTQDLILTAQYSIIDYNITYNNVGTLNVISNPSTYTIESEDITLAIPNDSIGNSFGGWFLNEALSDTINTPAITTGTTGDIEFYAKWAVFQFTVIFKDWDNSLINEQLVNYGNDAIAPNDPIREGYIFTGWDIEYTNVTQDLIITAQYSIIDYNITYNNVGTLNVISNPSTYTIESEDITLAIPNDSIGNSFGGWFLNEALSDTINTPAIPRGTTGDMEFYAKWAVFQFTVIFKDWDNSLINEQLVNYGNDAIPPNDPIREGYIFTGWDIEYTNVTQDLIITAQYSIIDYNINYNLDGGENSINNPATYTIEENIIFDVATKEGYSFDGWFTTNDFQNGTEVAEISQGSTGNVDIWAKFTLTTGLNNADANKLTLYPNPVIDGVLNIDCYETINEIKIFDLSGTLILRQTVNNKQSHSINIDYLKSGVYFVKIEEKVFRIIKE